MSSSSVKYLPPRNSLVWLVLALTLSILPIVGELPSWTMVVWSFVVFWRWQLFRDRWNPPSGLNKLVLVCVCTAGLFLSFGRFLALEPMVSLLVCAILLKLLEMQSKKDAQLLLYLGYFVVATQFLFSQSLSALFIGVLCLWVNTAALMMSHQPKGQAYPKRSFLLAGRLLLHSLPLMVLLFLIMPRIGSLWSIPHPSGGGVTGVSDSMSPGDFTRLSRSGGVAFRAEFEGARPLPHELYWRGLLFSEFDGRRWQPSASSIGTQGESWISWGQERTNRTSKDHAQASEKALGRSVSYDIILEATQQPWLYTLMLPTGYKSASDVSIIQTSNQRLVSEEPIRQRAVYRVESSLDYQVEPDFLPDSIRRVNLELPAEYNPLARKRAQQWRREEGSDKAYINRVLTFYNQSFIYTLEPPALGEHTVDDFLWGSQQGFCEHYASSFVVMMRAAGIPARVVAGYLGGEYNEAQGYYVVHQYDAHAWTEVWLDGHGWTRYDPTAAVAPERVEQSLGELQASLVESPWSLGRYRNFAFFNSLRLQWDAMNYRWHKSVMGFDSQRQSEFLNDWLDGVTPIKLVMVVLGGGGFILGMMTLQLWWRGRSGPVSPVIKSYLRVERLLARRGYLRGTGEPVGDFFKRVANSNPSAQDSLMRAVVVFNTATYGGETFDRQEMQQLMRAFKQHVKRRPQL